MDNTQRETVELNINGQKAQKQLEQLTERANDLKNALAKAAASGDFDPKEIKKMQTELNKTNKEIRQMKSATADVESVMKNLDKAAPNDLKRAISTLNKQINSGEIQRGTKRYHEATEQMQRMRQELEQINKLQRGAGTATGGGMLDSISSFLSSGVGKIGGVTAALGTLGAAIKAVVSKNAEFEQANADLAAILGVTRDQITDLTEDAKRLGAQTSFTASEVTGLQTELAKLGFSQNEIKNSTEAVLNFAAATGADLPSAASVAGAALRAFDLDATEMERVCATMSVSTTKSALDFSKLQTSISIVAPVAKQFGFSIEDTVALLGKLSDAGFDASSAATAVRNIFLYMADGSSKLSKTLGGPIKSLDDLAPAFQKLTDRGIDLAEMLDITDKRAVSAFATLVSQGNSLTQLRDDITDCGDAMQNMVDEKMNTLEGSTKKLSSAWEGLMLTFSNSTGPFKSVVDWLTRVVSQTTRLFSTISQNVNADVTERAKAVIKSSKKSWIDEAKNDTRDATEKMEEYSRNLAGAQKMVDDIQANIAEIEKQSGHELLADVARKRAKDLEKDLTAAQVAAAKYQTQLEYATKQATPDKPDKPTGGGGNVKAKKQNILEQQAAEDILSVQKDQEKNEQEKADAIYAINKALYENIRDLYDKDSQEYARYNKKAIEEETKHQAALAKRVKAESTTKSNAAKKEEKDAEKAANTQKKNEETLAKLADKVKLQQNKYSEKSDRVKALEAEKVNLEQEASQIVAIYDTLSDAGKAMADNVLAAINNMLGKVNDALAEGDGFDWDKFFGGSKTSDGKKIPGFDDYYNAFSSCLSSLSSLVDAEATEEETRINNKYDALIEAAEKNGDDTTALEEQKETEINKVKKEAAKKQYAIDILAASVDYAKSMIKTMAEYAYPYNLIMGAANTVAFGIQQAALKKNYDAEIAGYYGGGYTDEDDNAAQILGSQSQNRKYHRAVGLVHDGEFVANHYAVNNPAVKPTLDFIDQAQRNNTISRLTADDMAMAAQRVNGYAAGGYTSPTINVSSPSVTVQRDDNYARLSAILDRIEQNGISAWTYLDGDGGITEAQKRNAKLKLNKTRK